MKGRHRRDNRAEPTDEFYRAWQELDHRRRSFYWVCFGGVPLAIFAAANEEYLFKTGWLDVAVGAAWATGVAWVLSQLLRFACPRCGRQFQNMGLFRVRFGSAYAPDPWAKKCVHCELPIYARNRYEERRENAA